MWKKFGKQLWQWRGALVAAPSIAVLVALMRVLGLLQDLELAAFDLLLRQRPPEPIDDRVVIVEITEQDLQTVGTWPVPDAVLADALAEIAAGGPRAIGLDVYRDLPVEPGYPELVEIYRRVPEIIGIQKVGGRQVAPPPELKALDRVSSNDIPIDPDVKARRGLLYLSDGAGGTIFSLAFRLAWMYLEADGIEPDSTEDEQVMFGDTVLTRFESNDGPYIRVDSNGYQVLLLYRGVQGSFKRVSLSEVLAGTVPEDFFADRAVLIGATAESLKDYIETPYSSTLFGTPQLMAGVEYHANLTSQLISATLDDRALLKTWPEWLDYGAIVVAAFIGAFMSWTRRYTSTIRRVIPEIALVGVYGGIAYIALLQSWWIPLVPPILAGLGAAGAITAYVARSAADIRQTFSRYLTDEVVANLLETPGGLTMGGERRKITILTSDLRGFTSLSERLSPEQVVGILNIYLEAMADVITFYQGTIDEFMGDGILVLFGAPTQREDDIERAVACAIAMQKAMPAVNATMREKGLSDLEMGIGINTGEVVVGNIGSYKRTKYGVVGSQVNLTYRIESYTVGGQILISESTYEPVKELVQTDDEQKVSPKGVKQPISIYSVCGIGGKYNLELEKQEEELLELQDTVKIEFTIVEGKNVGATMTLGELVKLSPHYAEIVAPETIPALKNLKLRFADGSQFKPDDNEFYAKVIEPSADNGRGFQIRLTSVPSAVDKYLKTLHKERCRYP